MTKGAPLLRHQTIQNHCNAGDHTKSKISTIIIKASDFRHVLLDRKAYDHTHEKMEWQMQSSLQDDYHLTSGIEQKCRQHHT